jgi:hypothetical protein
MAENRIKNDTFIAMNQAFENRTIQKQDTNLSGFQMCLVFGSPL